MGAQGVEILISEVVYWTLILSAFTLGFLAGAVSMWKCDCHKKEEGRPTSGSGFGKRKRVR